MSRRQEQKEFEELQRRKKRRLEENRRRKEGYMEPLDIELEEAARHSRKPKKKKKKTIVTMIQILASLIFMVALLILNVLPFTYLMGITLLLLGLVLLVALLYRMRRKRGLGVRVFSLFISCTLILGSFYVLKLYSVLGEISGDVAASDVNVGKESFVVYISGIDVYGDLTTESRSDVNMLAIVNPNTYQILLVTTPRDYYVRIPEISGEERDKLTHAGIYGIDASMATLGALYDIDIDFYGRVNFTSLIDIVDALGGIDVNSELAFSTGEESGYVMDIQEGENHLTGEQALAFSRERKNLADGDNQRGKNQQMVITAMLRKMMSPVIVVKANSILNSVKENAQTDMARNQMQSLMKTYLRGGGNWKIKSIAAEGVGDSRYCFSYSGGPLYVTVPDETSVANVQATINAVLNGEVLEDGEQL